MSPESEESKTSRNRETATSARRRRGTPEPGTGPSTDAADGGGRCEKRGSTSAATAAGDSRETDSRLAGLARWLEEDCGLAAESIEPASADASFRRYFRVRTPQESFVAMDAPPEREDSAPFVRIAGWLREMGLAAPEVVASDLARGYLLLTDLGTQRYMDELRAGGGANRAGGHGAGDAGARADTDADTDTDTGGGSDTGAHPDTHPDTHSDTHSDTDTDADTNIDADADARARAPEPSEDATGAADGLYAAAIESLVKMQVEGRRYVSQLPPYDEKLLREELALFSDWFCGRRLELKFSATEERGWRACCDLLVETALEQPQVFVHRDYNSRNLMAPRAGDPGPGVLDFQDAVRGPLTYDLASLLRDQFLSWPESRVAAWAKSWHRQALEAGLVEELGPARFARWFDLTGAQRHLKVAGIFTRLWLRDGKPQYFADVPRNLGYLLDVAGRYPELAFLDRFIRERCLPALQACAR